MQYSSRKLLAALGISIAVGLALAACSSVRDKGIEYPTPTPVVRCQQPLTYKDTFLPGQSYEFFKYQRTSSNIRRIQYRGGNSFAFLDNFGSVVTPEEAKPYANPDGSVRFREGGKFTFKGNVFGSNDSFVIEITFERFEENKATVDVATSTCTKEQGLIH